MAGTHGGGGSKSPTASGMNTPARLSPRGSVDGMVDLLTGLYSTSNPFLVEEIGGRSIGEEKANSPRIVSPGNPSSADLTHNGQQHHTLDLLTGLFPPSSQSPLPSPVISPTPSMQNAWTADILAHPSFGSDSTSELFGTPVIARNNPFMHNAAAPAYSSPPHASSPHYLPQIVPNAGDTSSSGFMDGAFATFPALPDNVANLDPRTRSNPVRSAGPSPTSLSRPHSAGSMSSPTNLTNAKKTSGSLNIPNCMQKPDLSVRCSSVPSGIGLEKLQNGFPRSESSRSPLQHGSTVPINVGPSLSSPTNVKMRRSTPESKYDQRVTTAAGTSRTIGKEPLVVDARTSISPGKVGAANGEFIGASGKGIYRAPVRGAVHPSRPVSLELRPHPLRGAPVNQVTRLTCFQGSVWAACDLGLMVWDVKSATGAGCTGTGNNLGDEDAAAYNFLRSQGSSAACMVADVANQVVWTGHRDGKMRLWPVRAAHSVNRESGSASLTFQAHRPAVTALLVTPYGELWAGSESGELKAWPWDAVAKSLSGTADAASLMEKSYRDLRIHNLGVGPNGPINPEIRFLVGDHAHGTVWCAGAQYIALWDARTRELLRMFGGPSGLELNSLEPGSLGKEILPDDDLKVGYAKVTKKEKGGWLQRSRNAVMGAADAVRRVASGGVQGGDDGRRLEALVAAADGTVWGGYGNGLLVQWDGEGYRMQEHCWRPVSVRCMCPVGNRMWVGYSDGKLQVLSGETCRPVGSWVAHRYAVIQMTVCGGYIFSLGLSGSIRGWNISSPDRSLDGILAAAMTDKADAYTRQQHLRVLAGTWNTAQEKSSLQSVRVWLASPAAEASVVIVGLQEVEMGAGAIGMAAVKETVGMGLEKGSSATGHWWLSLIDSVVGEGKEFERVGSRQLAGMLVGVWVRRKLLPYVGEVEVGAVNCGFGRALGNKGAVGVKLMIFRRTICAITSHLAAHMEHVSRRNSDFERIYSQMSFSRALRTNVTVVGNAAAGVSSTLQNMLRGVNTTRRVSSTADQTFMERDPKLTSDFDPTSEDGGMPELADADLIIWTGDLNYRIDCLSYEDTVNLIYKKQWDMLLSRDQLRFEMGNGRTFNGFREGPIRFPPTYKFDKGTTGYDTSEKKRIPAWCDRVLCRDSFGCANDSSNLIKQGLIRPCKASVVWYESCMEPEESDHKPVRCMFNVDLSVIDEADRRREHGHIILADSQVQTSLAVSGYIPETVLSTNRLVLQDSTPSVLRLTNGDRQRHVVYVIYCEGLPDRGPCPCGQHSDSGVKSNGRADLKDQYPRGGYGFPSWLQVVPAAGVLEPCNSSSISVKIGMRSEDRGKDKQAKMAVLVVNVKGLFSPEYKQHRICVSYGPSSRSLGNEQAGPRRRSQDQQRRPLSGEKESQIYLSRTDHGSSRVTPDLLL